MEKSNLGDKVGVKNIDCYAVHFELWALYEVWLRGVFFQYILSIPISSACSLSAMFCYILLPNTFVFLGLEFILTKLYVLSFLSLLNSRQHLPGTDVPSHFTAPSDPRFVKSPTEDRYTPPLRNQTSSERRLRRAALRKTTSSFWSPPPPASVQVDEEKGYRDYLPADLSVQQSIGEVNEQCERSLSDESETVGGTLSPTSPTSAGSTDRLVIQRPPSIYNSVDVPVIFPTRRNSDFRPISNSSYPWHAR
jgi:hypothetical protein